MLLNEKDVIHFCVEYTETKLLFSYRSGADKQGAWASLSSVDALDMTGPDFVGPVIGVFATSQIPDVQVPFNHLEVN